MSLDHVSPPEMLLRQHHDIFSALEIVTAMRLRAQ
ncbi:hypothetical protein SEEMEL47_00787 [Salmonella enterica subsp. enterica serovar Meleagridis]|nr:hypothetical protein SEEMEL47_00787 [Salmonella enterica subsp. enterica serovar Meleagridis str. 0047]